MANEFQKQKAGTIGGGPVPANLTLEFYSNEIPMR